MPCVGVTLFVQDSQHLLDSKTKTLFSVTRNWFHVLLSTKAGVSCCQVTSIAHNYKLNRNQISLARFRMQPCVGHAGINSSCIRLRPLGGRGEEEVNKKSL